MNLKTLRSNLLLTLTALIWGSAFVAQSVGMDFIGPFTFNSVRSFIGALALVPVIFLFKNKEKPQSGTKKDLYLGGVICGVVLAVSSSLQQIGISMGTTAGKAGFITALYIVIVPFLNVFFGKKVTLKAWAAALIAIVGMYLLCINGGFNIAKSDFIVFLCAVCFSVHITVVDIFSPKVDGIKMSCIQFLVSGIVNFVPMLIFEHPQITPILMAWKPLLYAGILSSGVGYTLQIVAQKDTTPVAASLIMSLESVFALLTGWLVLGNVLSGRELLGCLLVLVGIILSQLPSLKKPSLCKK